MAIKAAVAISDTERRAGKSEGTRRWPVQAAMAFSTLAIGIPSALFLALLALGLLPAAPMVAGDGQLLTTLAIAGAYVGATLAIITALATWTCQTLPPSPAPLSIVGDAEATAVTPTTTPALNLDQILINEFDYARETAAQAMEERRTVFNFYLLVVGGAGSAVVGLLSTIANHAELLIGAVALLWVVAAIGVLTLFSIIALRLAWMGSANAMNYIKEFYLHNAERMDLSREILQSAFFFKSRTLPSAGKHWNAHHYIALLVSVLDAATFCGGTLLIGLLTGERDLGLVGVGGALLAIVLFMGHWWAYDLALMPKPPKKNRTKP